MTVRVCPERDIECPNGMNCPYAIDAYKCRPETHPDEAQQVPLRHQDTERNLILNRTSSDLESIIWGHDPEIDTSINNGVWDRLDKMAMEIEERQAAEIAKRDQKLMEFVDLIDQQAARIAELEAKSVKVKPLEWSWINGYPRCETPFGRYDIDSTGVLTFYSWRTNETEFLTDEGPEDDAKAAAQSDHESRVSALEVSDGD